MENTYLIPKINSVGLFEFYPPFDKKELDKKFYKVLSIRNINSMDESMEDPFNNIYLANGLTSLDFSKDVINNIPIIELELNGVETLYVPANKIKSMPNLYGYKYTPRMVTFKLGPIYDDYNLTTMYEDILSIIKDRLGIQAESIESPYGETVLVSEKEHKENIKMIYGTGTGLNKSYFTKYKELSRRYEEVNEKLKILEEGISKMLSDKEASSIIDSNK